MLNHVEPESGLVFTQDGEGECAGLESVPATGKHGLAVSVPIFTSQLCLFKQQPLYNAGTAS